MISKSNSKREASDCSSSDEEIDCPFSASEALNVCKEFAAATKTNNGLAMMILQKNNWNLEKAIENFQTNSKKKRTKSEEKKKNHFKVLSWNIDGLDEQNKTLQIRTKAVINLIQKEEPDAVFLQEVVPQSLTLIVDLLKNYEVHSAGEENYFVVILTRRETFKSIDKEIIEFPGTRMNRNLLIVHALYKDKIEIDLMTSHQESGTEENASKERIEQLKKSFQKMIEAPANRQIIFGGDLNLREKELKTVGKIPDEIVDLWIETGRRKECSFTWDMNKNDNNIYPSTKFKPRARFDRLYFRSNQNDSENTFRPVYFELEGLSRIPSIKRFPSDHWAIQAYFEVSS